MKDQAKLIEAVATLSSVSAVPGKNDKVKWLKKGDSDYLRALLLATYDKYQTYRIQQIEQPDIYAEVQPDTMTEFMGLCNDLAKHILGTNEARARIKKFLATNTKPVAEVFTNVLLRDLRMGCDEKTINKAFPGLIPTFDVMLADKLEDVDALPYPVVGETKLDGVRTIAVYDGETVKFFSREGREFDDCGVIAEQIAALAPGVPAVYDGEMIAFTPNLQDKTCKKNIKGNWPFYYGLSLLKSEDKTAKEVREHLKYWVWDVIDYDYFMSSGVGGRNEKLADRKMKLSGLFSRHEQAFSNIEQLPSLLIENRGELLATFRELRNQGAEGLMVKFLDSPYEFKRSKKLLKMKEFFSIDLRVQDAEEGTGKFAGLLGALVLADDTGRIKTKVGTGFTDLERADLWVAHLSSKLVGTIVEINGQEVTEDGSIRFPSFIRLREDKTTTNLEGIA